MHIIMLENLLGTLYTVSINFSSIFESFERFYSEINMTELTNKFKVLVLYYDFVNIL